MKPEGPDLGFILPPSSFILSTVCLAFLASWRFNIGFGPAQKNRKLCI